MQTTRHEPTIAKPRRRVDFPLCGVYTFGADDRLAGEPTDHDRATVLDHANAIPIALDT